MDYISSIFTYINNIFHFIKRSSEHKTDTEWQVHVYVELERLNQMRIEIRKIIRNNFNETSYCII